MRDTVLLHLMSTFSPLNETFSLREIRQLRADGWNVMIGQLRPLHKTSSTTGFEDLLPIVSPVKWISSDMLTGILFFIANRPREVWKCIKLISKSFRRPEHILKMVYILLSVMRLGSRYRGARVGLVRAAFLHSEALAARFLSWLLCVPYSVTVYTVFVHYPSCVIRDVAHGAIFLVADTAEAKRYLESIGIASDRIHVVQNSVDLQEFPIRSSSTNAGPPLILAVARLDPKKGIEVLLSACSIMRKRGVEFRCVIIGDGRERTELFEMRQRTGLEKVVEFVGELPFVKVKAWYYKAAVLAIPSVVTPEGDTDGLPTVVVEAMASGLPIVGANTGGIPEAVYDGLNGFLVPAGKPEALADRIQLLLEHEDLRVRLGKEGRRIAESQFDLRRKCEALSNLIEHSMRGRNFSIGELRESSNC